MDQKQIVQESRLLQRIYRYTNSYSYIIERKEIHILYVVSNKMKKLISLFLIVFMGAVSLLGCSKSENNKSENEKETITIMAAASLVDALDSIIEEYKKENSNVEIQVSYGGSGSLQIQIEEGAPADLFISAGEKQMDALEEKNLLVEGSRVDLLKNELVLIVPKESKTEISSISDLDKASNIGIGEIGSVPVGQYTKQALESLEVYEQLESKYVFANDVRTLLTWVENKEVDCGFVYKTDAISSSHVSIIETVDASLYDTVIYPMAKIAGREENTQLDSFITYLKGEKGTEIFESYGFTVE